MSGLVVVFSAVGLYLFILALLAHMGGWSALAAAFPAERGAPANVRSFVTVMFGWVRYNWCARVGDSERGLYVAPAWLCRPFHAPMEIPWHEIQKSERCWGGLRFVRVRQQSIGVSRRVGISGPR